MARYRHIDMSPRLLPVDLQAQLVPGPFAHALQHLVNQLDLSAFDAHYRNDDSGAPAHAAQGGAANTLRRSPPWHEKVSRQREAVATGQTHPERT